MTSRNSEQPFVVGLFLAAPSTGQVTAIPLHQSYGFIGTTQEAAQTPPAIDVTSTDAGDLQHRISVSGTAARFERKGAVMDDKNTERADTKTMTDMTRDDLSIALSSIEERMDKRIDRLAEEFRREMALRAEADQREAAARNEAVQAHLTSTHQMTERLERDFREVISVNKAQKYWLIGTGVAVILGIMGANATIFSGGKAFFDGGVEHASVKELLQEVKTQSTETRQLLEQLKAQQVAPQATSPQPAKQ